MHGERLTVRQLMESEGYADTAGFVEAMCERDVMDGSVPALCAEGCEVEPDGVCPHGNPSVLRALGVI